MYSGPTAPASTRICPASRIASSLLVAAPGVLICEAVRMSLMVPTMAQNAGVCSGAAAPVPEPDVTLPGSAGHPGIGARSRGAVTGLQLFPMVASQARPTASDGGLARSANCVDGGLASSANSGGGRAVGFPEFLDDLVVLWAVHEVRHRDMLRGRRLVPRPRRQILMRHDQIHIIDQVRDLHINDRTIVEHGPIDLI